MSHSSATQQRILCWAVYRNSRLKSVEGYIDHAGCLALKISRSAAYTSNTRHGVPVFENLGHPVHLASEQPISGAAVSVLTPVALTMSNILI